MGDTRRHGSNSGHLFLLTHLPLQHTKLRHIIEAPDVTCRILFIDHDGRNRKSKVNWNLPAVPGGDLETAESDLGQHSREDLPDRHLQGFARTVSHDFLSRPIEEINVSTEISSHQAGPQAVDDTITERLQECHLARRFFQFGICSSPTLGEEIREKRNGAEAKNTQADD